MVLIKVKKRIEVDNVFEFIEEFKLEKEFKKKFGVDINKWEYDVSDREVIEALLEDLKEKYLVIYVSNTEWGYFDILKF